MVAQRAAVFIHNTYWYSAHLQGDPLQGACPACVLVQPVAKSQRGQQNNTDAQSHVQVLVLVLALVGP